MRRWLLVLPALGAAIILLLQGCYLLMLTVAGFLYRHPRLDRAANQHRFAILVPAHDEERALPALLASIRAQSYPAAHYDVFVVADNCTDATAAVARAEGAAVFERQDAVNQGKGYALQWLLTQVEGQEAVYGAYVLLDADCTISSNFLEVMNARLQGGSRVIQAYYGALPSSQAIASLRSAALVLKHLVRPKGRAVLGLPCGLFGTGMVFHRDIITRHGWAAFTLAEDAEYQMDLVGNDVFVAFEPRAVVWSRMPESFRAARSQNARWEKGRMQMARRKGLPLLRRGIAQRRWTPVDAVLEQLMPPLSASLLAAGVLLPFGWALRSGRVRVTSGTALLTIVAHVFLGLISARAPLRMYFAFLFAPVFMAWKTTVYLTAFLPGASPWIRTSRL